MASTPSIHPDARVAADATVTGDVSIGAGARVASGARLVAEPGSSISVGACTIVLENAVLRATQRQSLTIGDHCLIGPHAHVVGATIGDEVFVATGASVFHGAILEPGSEVRINAVVHLRSRLEAGVNVPIGWVAVGDPAQLFPPDRHEEIWALQAPLDFPGYVYGVDRGEDHPMRAITEAMSARLGEVD
ncbi:MAG: gamma carbonic anhydrase family protein [Acidimicrobiales bacterium]